MDTIFVSADACTCRVFIQSKQDSKFILRKAHPLSGCFQP